ncbi:hypothetical protein MRO89_09620 [Dickeya dianthicola]|nr:hypothetical protein [Dickeya dianthicola]MCI4029783.1 hypothetical protein [Dickeya dianthicola]MCI4173182.1 hypothetical protein [Dickeya dianthicola]MCI4176852.1 hypothetical protein [Dickeya dianthicola]MCI4182334.1 hypothetical protein [Dickeya dianthicola]MCI4186221.1 hypothetical protein [Dickeya dianthicola]
MAKSLKATIQIRVIGENDLSGLHAGPFQSVRVPNPTDEWYHGAYSYHIE